MLERSARREDHHLSDEPPIAALEEELAGDRQGGRAKR
jgi:hypothetical protein